MKTLKITLPGYKKGVWEATSEIYISIIDGFLVIDDIAPDLPAIPTIKVKILWSGNFFAGQWETAKEFLSDHAIYFLFKKSYILPAGETVTGDKFYKFNAKKLKNVA